MAHITQDNKDKLIRTFFETSFVIISFGVAIGFYKFISDLELDFTFGPIKAGGAAALFLSTWWYIRFGVFSPKKKSQKQKDKLNEVIAKLVECPGDKSKYLDLFTGFTEEFYGYNAPFQIDSEDSNINDDVQKTQIERYRNHVKSQYIFFQAEAYNKAIKLVEKMQQNKNWPKHNYKISLIFFEPTKKIKEPDYTFFLGKKEKRPVIILYPTVAVQQGVPSSAIYIEGDNGLYNILHQHFITAINLKSDGVHEKKNFG